MQPRLLVEADVGALRLRLRALEEPSPPDFLPAEFLYSGPDMEAVRDVLSNFRGVRE